MINRRAILRGIADMCRLFTLAFLVPVPVAFLMEPWDFGVGDFRVPFNAVVFLASGAACTIFWAWVKLFTDEVEDQAKLDREGYLAVAAGWLVITLFAAMPFALSGVLVHPVDAFFESMSGISTTGASVMGDRLEGAAPSILFWRALLQWIGGLGIIVLLVALLANLTQGGSALMRAEASIHTESRLRPKLTDTARVLGKVYIVISALMIAILYPLMRRVGLSPGEALYDAVYQTFTTVSTGGYSNHANSVGFYDSLAIEIVVIAFMIIGATQFLLLLPRSRRWLWDLARDPQWRFMVGLWIAASAVVAGILVRDGTGAGRAVREALFAVITTMTGTGHAAADFGIWPPAALIILMMMLLTGGNAGSTAGGIKSGRFVLLAKTVKREIVKLLHPRAVASVRMGGRIVPEDAVSKAVAFFFAYITIWVVGTIAVSILEPGMSIIGSASASASAIGNTGVGLAEVGPSGSYADLSHATKTLLAVLMWVGRLEIFTAALLFHPDSWRH